MIRILDRYLLTQVGVPLIFILIGFLIFWLSGDIIAKLEDFQDKGLHAAEVINYYLMKLPGFLDLLGPVGFLLGLLYGLLQLTRHHETTAIRASGVSLWRLSIPIFALSLCMGSLSFSYKEFLMINFEAQAEEIMSGRKNAIGENIKEAHKSLFFYRNEVEDRRWGISSYITGDSIEFSEVDVEWPLTNGLRRVLFANKALYKDGKWVFENATSYDISDTNNKNLTPSLHSTLEIESSTLPETPEFLISQFKISRIENVRDKRLSHFNIQEISNLKKLFPNMKNEDRRLLDTKFHMQISAGFTYLVVAMVAIPLGCRPGRRDVFMGVAVSMGVCFGYFVIQRISAPLGYSGKLPPLLAAWLPNVIFGFAGFTLMFKANKQ